MSAHKPESNKACAVRMGAHGFFEVRQVTRMESARDRPLHATRPATAVKAMARVHNSGSAHRARNASISSHPACPSEAAGTRSARGPGAVATVSIGYLPFIR
jgi:hypothetical protein